MKEKQKGVEETHPGNKPQLGCWIWISINWTCCAWLVQLKESAQTVQAAWKKTSSPLEAVINI